MKIKMKSLDAGPNGVRLPGKEYEVSDQEGRSLVESGYAEEISSKHEQSNELPSVDEFAELKADEQKALLKRLGIEGDDSNSEKRTALYAGYLTGGDGDGESDEGQTDNTASDGAGDVDGGEESSED